MVTALPSNDGLERTREGVCLVVAEFHSDSSE